jgi:CHAD domain-containing protein
MKRFLREQTAHRVHSLRDVLAAFDSSPESLHDLRVATRRVQQCQRLFGKPSRKLHRLMELSSAVRNCDVTLELLESAHILNARINQQLKSQREIALAELTSFLAQKFEFGVRHHKSLKRRDLRRMVEKWFKAGAAAETEDNPASLHRFRLLGKRLRYTLELFTDVYGPPLEKLLRQLRSVQDHLGAIQDCVAALPLVADHPRAVAALTRLQSTREHAFRTSWKTDKGDAWRSIFSATAKPKTEPRAATTPTAS